MAPRFFARQLSHPSGTLGRVVGGLMNRFNRGVTGYAIEQLALEPSDRVLEIGFGGGMMLDTLTQRARFVAGLDRSELMVRRARARLEPLIAAGRVDIREGVVESMPFPDASFDKALTVNTVYFWSSLGAGFAELHRVLAAGGRLAVGFLPKEHRDRLAMPADIFTTRAPDDVVGALGDAGFSGARVMRPRPTIPWNVVVADR
jgi:SAM-dependent methyltransferase